MPESRFTWAEYDRRGDEIGGLLSALGHDPGERVAVILPDGPGGPLRLRRRRAGRAGRGRDRLAGPATGRSPTSWASPAPPPSSPCPSTATAPAADLRAALAASGVDLRTHVLVDRSGAVVGVEGERRADPGDTGPLAAARARRAVPVELDLGHHRAPEVRDAHPEPLVLLPPPRRARPAPSATTRSSWARSPRRSASGSGPAHFTPAILGVPDRGHGALRRRHRPRPRRAGAGHRAVLRQHAVHHDARRPGPSGPATSSSLRSMFTGGEAVPYERAAAFEDTHRRQGAAVLRLQRDRRPQPHHGRRRPRAPPAHRRSPHRRDGGASARPGDPPALPAGSRTGPAGLQGPGHLPRLLGRRGGQRQAVHRRRLDADGRHRRDRRRRLPAGDRAHVGLHHPRRQEHQRPGGRGGAVGTHPRVAMVAAVAMPGPGVRRAASASTSSRGARPRQPRRHPRPPARARRLPRVVPRAPGGGRASCPGPREARSPRASCERTPSGGRRPPAAS